MIQRARINENHIALVVFLIAAWLSLYNLGNASIWRDEAAMANTAQHLLRTGGYNGWDGRNLFIMYNGTALNSDLKIASFPPWPAIPSALGIAIFGENEIGVRLFHALLGLGAIVFFWFLLKLDFLHQPRLRLLAFTLFALSAQVLLFIRQGRYCADAMFFALVMFYAYRLYISERGAQWHLAIAAAAFVLGFLNHFAIGASFALAVFVWHLIYYFRQTSRRQWIEFAVAGGVSAALCLWYLFAMKIIGGDDVLEYTSYSYQLSWFERKMTLTAYNFRDMLQFGWLPLWVAIALVVIFLTRKPSPDAAAQPDEYVLRYLVLAALFLAFSGITSPRLVAIHILADSRYLVAALPFCALFQGVVVDRVWRQPRSRGAMVGIPLLLALLLSNLPSYPYIFPRLRLTLPPLVGEIHRPYNDATGEVVSYLREHANQDDTILVEPWQDASTLLFYLSDTLIFCCALDKQSPLPEDSIRRLGAPLYKGDVEPRWIVHFASGAPDAAKYELVYSSEKLAYPTQRPELEFHTFRSVPAAPDKGLSGAFVYKKR